MTSTSGLSIDGKTGFFEGEMTLAQARQHLARGRAAIEQGVTDFDLSRVTQLDSSAISVLLGLRRFAAARGQGVVLRGLSDSLIGLARLYGVADHL